jgi:hypothetical protein
MISHSTLAIGPQGSGKSHLARTALKHYGSGIVVMARGMDEVNSYYPMAEDVDHYTFRGFDDPDFQVLIGSKGAHGALDMVNFLEEQKVRVEAMAPEDRPKVLVFDTATGIGDLALNATLQKFGMTEPPPVRGERGFPFFSYLSRVQAGIFAKGRSLRALGLHWFVLAQAAERETTPEQAAPNPGMLRKQVMAAVPGGFRDMIGQYFDQVFQVQAIVVSGKQPVHQMLWLPDTQHGTKSRWGNLTQNLKPIENDWPKVLVELERLAAARA